MILLRIKGSSEMIELVNKKLLVKKNTNIYFSQTLIETLNCNNIIISSEKENLNKFSDYLKYISSV